MGALWVSIEHTGLTSALVAPSSPQHHTVIAGAVWTTIEW